MDGSDWSKYGLGNGWEFGMAVSVVVECWWQVLVEELDSDGFECWNGFSFVGF